MQSVARVRQRQLSYLFVEKTSPYLSSVDILKPNLVRLCHGDAEHYFSGLVCLSDTKLKFCVLIKMDIVIVPEC